MLPTKSLWFVQASWWRFYFPRLNAMEYSDLKEKLRSPVRHAQDVIIHQSLSDRFLAAFREHAEKNEPSYKDPNMVRRWWMVAGYDYIKHELWGRMLTP